jgi:hypothetical protein
MAMVLNLSHPAAVVVLINGSDFIPVAVVGVRTNHLVMPAPTTQFLFIIFSFKAGWLFRSLPRGIVLLPRCTWSFPALVGRNFAFGETKPAETLH